MEGPMAQDLMAVANELVAGCREGREMQNLEALYAEDAVSVEAAEFSEGSRTTEGREAIKGKHAWWNANFEVHGASVEGPFPHGDDRFAVIFEMDTSNRETGERSAMKEVGVYHVQDGRITREEFFYGVPES
ncbi:nuclear transport factor 2 family protein [Rhodobacteraceae bacterium CCMM004]|nr:nuclear transport factor 2 family protein [Rhodobacteraceae bacterium CCMM004]